MDFLCFLDEIRRSPDYAGQIVYVHEVPARPARLAPPDFPLAAELRPVLERRGIDRLYIHQARAIQAVRDGLDVLITTGPASGKTLCYLLPILESLLHSPDATAMVLSPTKALSQDQFGAFKEALDCCSIAEAPSGVYDGDTPARLRRNLRDRGRVIFTNPDMLHAALMPQHGRWARFLANLRFVVVDEIHVYNGIFGANVANLFRRFARLWRHYAASPQLIACSATIANPAELARHVTGRDMVVVDEDGSPQGRRIYVLWNPPRVRPGRYRSRRSANVEAHELMAELIKRGAATITFSKAKMTAEMIYRYVREALENQAPHLASRVAAYRGGYLPPDRRAIEKRLFSGELLGVSTTPALELGIDVGELDATIIVGYPGTLASFFQQAGRAGRRERDALVILVGLDTAINQYIMSNPNYLFGRPVERAVVDEANPFVVSAHLRCAAHELPLAAEELRLFGPHASLAVRVLEETGKVKRIGDRWYHSSAEVPQHEVSLRTFSDANVVIQDIQTGEALGEIDKYDAQPILHPHAIYMHQGDTYQVLELDLDRNIATVQRVEVDYYTDPIGGTDVHHVDHCLREKPFGTGRACWGEVTAYFSTIGYEKVRFYSLDAVSQHALDLPTMVLETMAFWLIPPEELMEEVAAAGLDAHAGLRGIGYATRMLLPLFITCDTFDFSHSIGSANTPWNTVFVYERYPLGMGFTEKAYERLGQIMPAVLEHIRKCPCQRGCPCCVGKPLRAYATWNVERGEGHIPAKPAAIAILEGLLGDGSRLHEPDCDALADTDAAADLRLERALRRHLERTGEPQVLHPILPDPPVGYPPPAPSSATARPDVERRIAGAREFARKLRRKLASQEAINGLPPTAPRARPPAGMRVRGSNAPPTAFPGRPVPGAGSSGAGCLRQAHVADGECKPDQPGAAPIEQGDPLAARVRRMKRKRRDGEGWQQ